MQEPWLLFAFVEIRLLLMSDYDQRNWSSLTILRRQRSPSIRPRPAAEGDYALRHPPLWVETKVVVAALVHLAGRAAGGEVAAASALTVTAG